jgi:hypothetical protein
MSWRPIGDENAVRRRPACLAEDGTTTGRLKEVTQRAKVYPQY